MAHCRDTLAESFAEVAEVIGDVIDMDKNDHAPDLLAIYERWRTHGDPRDAKLLVRAGVIIDADGSDVLQ